MKFKSESLQLKSNLQVRALSLLMNDMYIDIVCNGRKEEKRPKKVNQWDQLPLLKWNNLSTDCISVVIAVNDFIHLNSISTYFRMFD